MINSQIKKRRWVFLGVIINEIVNLPELNFQHILNEVL